MAHRPRVASRPGVASLALLPMAATVLVAYLGSMLWTLAVSFTSSRTFPAADFVGLAQYQRLFDNERWSQACTTWRCTGCCSSWPAS
jgi:glucose/mannose transport system permease protein